MVDKIVTRTDCKKIIRKKLKCENFSIEDFHQERLGEFKGYLGEHSILQVTIKRNGIEETHKFFVKSLPTEPSQRRLALDINAFGKEESFYVTFCQELKKYSIDLLFDRIPVCFISTPEAIVFEDLTAKGYESLPLAEPLKSDFVKSGLVTLARLHASGLVLEKRRRQLLVDDFPELTKSSFSDQKSVESAIFKTKRGFEALIDCCQNIADKNGFKTKVFDSYESWKEFVKPSTKYQNCLCHGDPWTNNFMFKTDEKVKSVIIDFQSYRYCPPAQDVMVFLHLVMNSEDRRENFTSLLNFYYKELNDNLEKHGLRNFISKTDFFDSCQYFREFALIQKLSRCQVVGGFVSECEDRYDFVKNLCQNDAHFRKINFEALEDLRRFYDEQT